MSKMKYLCQRIIKMNYHSFFQTANKIALKTKKNSKLVLLDIIYCGLKYQAGYKDYDLFEMYSLNKKQRQTIITRGINNGIIKKYNNKKHTEVFNNKLLFNQKFNKYLGRQWIVINGYNFNEFENFAKEKRKFIAKPLSESCGKGVELYVSKENNLEKLYKKLEKNKQLLIEEVATQSPELKRLHPSSINTMRVVTLKQKVVVAFLRIGNNDYIVDNFNHQGLAAPINISTGIIDYLAVDKAGNQYEKHPLTQEPILWFKIPKWPRIKRFCENAAKVIPEVGYVGWDVSINENGPFLIEANDLPGHDIYQLPPHRSEGIGLLPIFKEVMEEKNENIYRK